MKKIIKNLFCFTLVALATIGLTSCGNDDRLKVGVLQYATHDALDAAYDGIIEALTEAGYTDEKIKIDLKNPQGEATPMATMAKKLVRESDIIFAIATPAAQAVKAELENQGKSIPTFFTAVTDGVDANLIASNDAPGGCITGTSDMNPVSDQIDLIKTLVPTATKIGILYTSAEDNSRIQAEMAEDAIDALGLTSVVKTVTSANDLQLTFNALANTDDVDAIYIPTDNLLAAQMIQVKELSKNSKVPVICGEESMVRKGGTGTLGINYKTLGNLTGGMAVDYLKNGTDVSTMAIKECKASELSYIINKTMCDELEIKIPASLADAIIVQD